MLRKYRKIFLFIVYALYGITGLLIKMHVISLNGLKFGLMMLFAHLFMSFIMSLMLT